MFHHPAVLEAALELAADRAATPSSRVAGLWIAGSYYQEGLMPAEMKSVGEALSKPLETCSFLHLIVDWQEYLVNDPLPPNHIERTHALTSLLAVDSTEPELTRNFAACLQRMIRAALPVRIDVARLKLRYHCEGYFYVRNDNDDVAVVQYEVEGTEESGDLEIGPHQEALGFSLEPGTLNVSYEGHLVGSAKIDYRECPVEP
jgi:hypothetical protein